MVQLKYYAVRCGRHPGVYSTWKEAQAQVNGFAGAMFKSFAGENEAEAFMKGKICSTDLKKKGEIIATPLLYSGQKETISEWMKSEHIPHLLRFDGGSRGDSSTAGSGAVLYRLEEISKDKKSQHEWKLKMCYKGYRYIGDQKTNNEAEYDGLLLGLQAALKLNVQAMIIEGDSKMVVKQVEGLWNVNKDHLQTLLDKVAPLYASVPNVQIHHISREDNNAADALSTTAIYEEDTKETFLQESNVHEDDENVFEQESLEKIVAPETPKFYAVRFGVKPGVYSTWQEAEEQINGFSGAMFKGFSSEKEAKAFVKSREKVKSIKYFRNMTGRGNTTSDTHYADEKEVVEKWIEDDYVPYLLRFDGGSRGTESKGGSGAVLYRLDETYQGREGWKLNLAYKGYRYIGENKTNNEAEYDGLLLGLQAARKLNVKALIIEGDSKLVVKQVEGGWRTRAPHLQTLLGEIAPLYKAFPRVLIRHNPREGNNTADALATTAIVGEKSDTTTFVEQPESYDDDDEKVPLEKTVEE